MQDCCQIYGKALKFDGFSEIYGIDGYRIKEYMGVLCGEIVVPNGLLGVVTSGTL
ncbi:MAG: hypothetical protein K6G05_07020 [Lachnospiraceae bacterium]|nr:hypothetical protein [Lachnospiraceae bacterium]